MSYEDSFEREARDERCYKDFEQTYIYENMKPESIGPWEWRLMFEKVPMHRNFSDAARDAKEMASELRCNVYLIFNSLYQAEPENLYMTPEDMARLETDGSAKTYRVRRARFIQSLILEGRYPDIVKISREQGHRESAAIWRGYINGIKSSHEHLLMIAKEIGSNEPIAVSRRLREIYGWN